MLTRRLLPGLLLLVSTASAAPVALGPKERIVFYGDSITEQNRYTSLIEAFLISRLPGQHLAFFNYGWSGDTARGGNARFARDVAWVKPTLAIVNFGMNDGGYGGFDQWILDAWLPPQGGIADQLKALGAREVLLTTSIVEPHNDETKWLEGYNDTLARMAKELKAFGAKRGLPVVDLNTPMREAVARIKAKDPKAVLVPDGIHPGDGGALIMAWAALKGFAVPAGIGDVTIRSGKVSATGGVKVAGATTKNGETSFDLTLPFLPFWIPRDCRSILESVPFEDELNRFRLTATGIAPSATVWLLVDGRLAGTFTGAALAKGLDAALLDNATWARQGRQLRDIADRRFERRFDAWRKVALGDRAGAREQAARDAIVAAEEADAAVLADLEHEMAQPRTSRVVLATRNPWSQEGGLPRLVEGFEDPDLPGIGCWDESVAIASSTAFVTEGARSARLTIDGARYNWPALFVDFAPALDLSRAPKLAVDVYVPAGTIPAGETLTAHAEVKSGKVGRSAVAQGPLKDGGWTTCVFDFGASVWTEKDKDAGSPCPADLRRAINAFGLTIVSGANKAAGAVYVDNLRVTE